MSRRRSPRPLGVRWRWIRVASLILVAWSLLAWIAAEALIVDSKLQHADALVVLAGSSTYLERTRYAARLFHEGHAAKILLTNDAVKGGYSVTEDRNPLFVERAVAQLRQEAVPADRIEMVPGIAQNTYEESQLLLEYARVHDLKSILVVTSAYQSRRALWVLRRVFVGSGIEVGLEAVAPGEQAPRALSWWLYPLGWKMVPLEWIKLGYYLLCY